MRFTQGLFGSGLGVVVAGWAVGWVLLGTPSAHAFDFSQLFKISYDGSDSTSLGTDDLLGLECQGENKRPLGYMNETVLDWKFSTRDQFQSRALVRGPITNFLEDRPSHIHFGINLNSDGKGDLEVIYNKSFGELPQLFIGMMVSACGDYITVGPRARRPSPMGAIIHWVHYNPGDRDGGKHPHGFLIINKQPYGVSASDRAAAQRFRRY